VSTSHGREETTDNVPFIAHGKKHSRKYIMTMHYGGMKVLLVAYVSGFIARCQLLMANVLLARCV
jgi:hypothetical protein